MNYSSPNDFLKYINIWRHPLFHSVHMFKNNKYFGYGGYNEIGCCGGITIIESEEKFVPQSYLKQIKRLKKIEPENLFYIRGILFAWWNIKNKYIYMYITLMMIQYINIKIF